MSENAAVAAPAADEPYEGPRYFARQLSDLDFNDRLLDLVVDDRVPCSNRSSSWPCSASGSMSSSRSTWPGSCDRWGRESRPDPSTG